MKFLKLLLLASLFSCSKKEPGISKIAYVRQTPLLLETGELINYADTIIAYFRDMNFVIAIPVYADDPGTSSQGDVNLGPTNTIIYKYLIGNKNEPHGYIIDTFNTNTKRRQVISDSVIKSLGIGTLNLSKLDSLSVFEDSLFTDKQVLLKYHIKNPTVNDGDSIELSLSNVFSNQLVSISKEFDSKHRPYRLTKFRLKYNGVFSAKLNKMLPERELKLEILNSEITEKDKPAISYLK